MAKASKVGTIDISKILHLNPHLAIQEPIKKKSKFNNIKTEVDGDVFDSKKEAKRYGELKLLLKAGHIGFLARQVEFLFNVEGIKVASYFADFCYRDAKTGEFIVEDVKSEVTRKLPVYRLKRKLMLSIHKIKIKEV